jgi:hypothetical protein
VTGIQHVTTAVFLIVKPFWINVGSRRNIWDVSATPSGIKREWYIRFLPMDCKVKYLIEIRVLLLCKVLINLLCLLHTKASPEQSEILLCIITLNVLYWYSLNKG